jgi:hypothetical protein
LVKTPFNLRLRYNGKYKFVTWPVISPGPSRLKPDQSRGFQAKPEPAHHYSEHFSDLLSKNPDIASYVTSLSYRVSNPISDHGSELNTLDMLKEHASLQLIQLSPREALAALTALWPFALNRYVRP